MSSLIKIVEQAKLIYGGRADPWLPGAMRREWTAKGHGRTLWGVMEIF